MFVDPTDAGTGAAVFGYDYGSIVNADQVLATINPVLDEPDNDTGWQPMPSSLDCKAASAYRSIVWDDLRFVLEQYADGTVTLGAWSIGDVDLAFSPPLDTTITQASGLTSVSGLGIGSPKAAIMNEAWAQVGDYGNQVQALSGPGPVIFELVDGAVTAFSSEVNDCYSPDADM